MTKRPEENVEFRVYTSHLYQADSSTSLNKICLGTEGIYKSGAFQKMLLLSWKAYDSVQL